METIELLKLEVKYMRGKGVGVITHVPFRAGEIVVEGVIERFLSKNDSHASQIDENLYARHGGVSPSINHSCDPNLGIRVNSSGAHDLVAFRDIEVGEELTYDYAMRNYEIQHFKERCLCGARNCRGAVKGWKFLSEERKNDYREFSAPFLHKLDLKYHG